MYHSFFQLFLTIKKAKSWFLLTTVYAVRKGYHILAAALFIPPLLLSKELLGMALAVAFAALAAVEVLRLSNIPLIGLFY